MLWRECAEVAMPRAVVVTKLDHARADHDGVVAQAREAFGDRVLPVYLREDDRLVGLITGDHGHAEQREALIEAVIEESEDETLMERYVGGEDIGAELLVRDLERRSPAGRSTRCVPVTPHRASGPRSCSTSSSAPSPPRSSTRCRRSFTPAGRPGPRPAVRPDGPLVAEVVKTTTDPYVGRVSLVRVFSGTVRPDATVHVSGHRSAWAGGEPATGHEDHDEDERVGTLSIPLGKAQRPAPAVVAGDLCAIGRLSRAETSDTLSAVETRWCWSRGRCPTPSCRWRSGSGPRATRTSRPGAPAPGGRGPHAARRAPRRDPPDRAVDDGRGPRRRAPRPAREPVRRGRDQVELRVPLRETFAQPATGHGRHVKQSGGHGQYAVCTLEVEPLPQGAGFEFVDKVVGGAVPRQFIPSVEKGVRSQMERGVANGYPVVDLRVTLTDGKAHSVDSSDMAFQTAGALALRDAAARGRTCLLEPVDEVEVLVADDLVGTVMGDLSSRRGKVLGSDQADRPGVVVVRAEVPQLEIRRYSAELRSFSHGSASFRRAFARYEPVPETVAAKLMSAAD